VDYYDLAADGMRRCDERQVEQVPWRRIAALLESIETERTAEELARRTLESLELVIPFDRAFILETSATNPGRATFYKHSNSSEPIFGEYTRHYQFVDPMIRVLRQTRLGFVDWKRFKEDEFSRDFIPRTGASMGFGMSDRCQGGETSFTLIAGRFSGSDFTDLEKLTVSALFPHLHNLYAAAMDPAGFRARKLQDAFRTAELTPREEEVAFLLCRGLSVSEIAETLFVSRKTAAKHLEHIYNKLGVSGKRQARDLLLHRTIPYNAGEPLPHRNLQPLHFGLTQR
jgi:DNA-binding CsgD family transcriptional regulator